MRSPTALGFGLTLASAVFLSTLGVLTQLAYDAGASVGTMLAGRFLVASAVVWLLVWIVRARRPSRRQAVAGLALGVGFSAHAWLFSMSLVRLDAGLVDLLVFTYPTLVMLAAVVLGRDSWSWSRALALATATSGTTLVLVGGLHSIDLLGAVLALGSAIAYAAYILASADQVERTDPLFLTALVTTGAAVTLTVAGAARQDLSVAIGASAFVFVAIVGLVAVAGMGTFIAGIGRLGPSRASIVSAVQPALTPLVGYAVFADRLRAAQVLGAALVIAAMVILESGGLLSARPWLAWLPWRERRQFTRMATRLDVRVGEAVLRQGEDADAFFVIERGHATVLREERRIAELGPGEFFGEIAMLRGGGRTASVVAASSMRVRMVSRREFARAMTALPTLSHAIKHASRERLVAIGSPAAA